MTNVYDGFGRLSSSSSNRDGVTRTLSYLYDADGNRTRVTHPDSVYFTYDYDGLDRMTTVKENGTTAIASIVYNAKGQRSSLTRGAVVTSYTYDVASRLWTLGDDLAGTAQDVTTTLTYNNANQIATQGRTNDAYAFTGLVNVNRAYVPNALNQYKTAGPATFTYDANGNLIDDGTTDFTYDAENRLLTRVHGTNTLASLVYDPLGRLYQTSGGSAGTTRFLYDGDELVAEYNSSGTLLRRYVHGPGDDDPLIWYEGATVGASSRRSLQTDQQGSVVSVADSTGAAIGIDSYDEYGIPAAANIGRFQYTGQAWIDELGMYHYKARIYSPTMGRFLQTDPVGYDDQINLYAYVANDPVNQTDPTGNCLTCVTAAIGAGGGALVGLGSQIFADVVTGQVSGPEAYLGSIAGGAAGGAVLGATGNVVAAGAVGGAVSGAISQGVGAALKPGATASSIAGATVKGAAVGGAVGAAGGAGGKFLAAGGKGVVANLAQKTGVGRAISSNEKMTNMMMGKVAAGAQTSEKTGYKMIAGQATAGAGAGVATATACTASKQC